MQFQSMAGLVALGALSVAGAAAAGPVQFPPAGSHSFIELYEIDSGQHVCQPVCTFASSLGQSVSIPDFSASPTPFFMNATGSVSPTAIHSFVSSNVGVEFDLATSDTYTVHGGNGPFDITAHLDASGTTSTIQVSSSLFFDFIPNITVRIGTLDIDPSAGEPIVFPFNAAAEGHTVAPNIISNSPGSEPISASASYTRTVNPGDVFDMAFWLNTQFSEGTVDLSHTANISFDLPDGVWLTSAGGATFGTPSTGPGIPEPAAWTLMISGFGLAGATLRRRQSHAALF